MFGRVLWFDSAKGYGFIRSSDGRELFFHHSQIDMEGYRYAYSGSPVEIKLKENEDGEEVIEKVKIIQRKSPSGKPIILIAHHRITLDSTLTQFTFDIGHKAESGIKYLSTIDDLILCSDRVLNHEQMVIAKRFINAGMKINSPVETDTEYDYMFV
jgi:CspA family cold shock protein